jgi:hypothetical protein
MKRKVDAVEAERIKAREDSKKAYELERKKQADEDAAYEQKLQEVFLIKPCN